MVFVLSPCIRGTTKTEEEYELKKVFILSPCIRGTSEAEGVIDEMFYPSVLRTPPLKAGEDYE